MPRLRRDVVAVDLYPRRYYAMLRDDAMTSMDRLQPGPFFCLCTRPRKFGTGARSDSVCRSRRSQALFRGEWFTVIRSSSSMNSHRTSVGGNPSFAIFPATTVALPTMPEAIRPVMSPKMHLCIAGSSRSTTSLAMMRDLKIERAHLVGLSMGGYAALQFGVRYTEKTSALIAASVGSGSHPFHRDAWLRETSVLARIFIEHGMVSMAERMARGPARIQLKYKDQKGWREFVDRLRQHSALGMSNTMARCQALRPSLHDLRDQFSEMTCSGIARRGRRGCSLLRNQSDARINSSQRGSVDLPQYWPGINLEEPFAFNTQVENFLGAVERGCWRRGFPGTEVAPHLGWCRRACRDNSSVQVDSEAADAGAICLHD